MKKIAELVKEHADGKQPLVDVWWALGILMMYGVRYYQHSMLGIDLYAI